MKFGKRMRCLAAPEWEAGYVDYKSLKRMIKEEVQEQSATFHQSMRIEMAKVNAFFYHALEETNATYFHPLLNDLKSLQNVYPITINQLNQILTLLVDLCNRTDAMRRFVVLNYLAIIKISKKHDKMTHNKLKPIIMRELMVQPFYAGSYLDNLYSETSNVMDQILLKIPFSTSNSNTLQDTRDSINDSASCPICLYTFTSPVTLSCLHTFCWSCLAKAAEHHIHACPMCRQIQSIDPRDYEIDGLVKRFQTIYSKYLTSQEFLINQRDIELSKCIQNAVDSATEYIIFSQLQYSMAPSCTIDNKSSIETAQTISNYPSKASKAPLNHDTITVAHRGASGTCRANTLASFEKAVQLKANMVHMDVQLCASGELVCVQERMAPNGRFVYDLSFEELQSLKPDIITLDQALNCINKRSLIYVELKCSRSIPQLFACLSCQIWDNKYLSSMFYIASFNHYQLIALNGYKNQYPEFNSFHTVALTSSVPLGYCKIYEQLNVSYICVDSNIVNQNFIMDAHDRNIGVFVYTVNHMNVALQMLNLQVDGIISDFPDMVSLCMLQHSISVSLYTPTLTDSKQSASNGFSEALPHDKAISLDLVTIEKMYVAGDPVEIQCPQNSTLNWFSGVIIGCNDNGTYSVLWWMSDNSQRRATQVLGSQLREPVPKYSMPFLNVAADVFKVAIEWALFPIDKIRALSASA